VISVPTEQLLYILFTTPSAPASATVRVDNDDEVPILRFSRNTAPVSCYGGAEVPLLPPGVSPLSSSTSPPSVRP
jgi:hypothetical protein